MTITLTSRKAARGQLKTVLKTGIETAYNIVGFVMPVYEGEPKDFGGLSPALTLHDGGTMTEFADYARERHRFWLTTYWKRDDPKTVEDAIADLSQAVRQTLIDNTEAQGYWEDLEFDDEFSEMTYVLVDGVQYRSERMRVTVFSVCDNGGVP